MLDTFKHTKTLEESGLPKKQAEAHVKVLTNIIGGHLVTKETFEHHMEMIQKDFVLIRQEIQHQFEISKRDAIEQFVSKQDLKDAIDKIKKEFQDVELLIVDNLTIRMGKMMTTLLAIAVGVLAWIN